MKLKKNVKAVISAVLAVLMIMSMTTLGIVGISAAGGLEITYNFKYQNAGYAEGRIELKAGSSADYGTYYLYWANDTKALDGYAPITTVTLNTSMKYFEFDEFTAIPADATKVIAVKSTTNKTVSAASAVYDIPASKQFAAASSEKQYDFQALSDIHIQHDDSYWVHSKPHFANALNMAAKRDVEFIAICGDQVNGYGYSNLEKEWPQYLRIIADSDFANPIYETNGNHEIKGNGDKQAQTQDHNIYKIASGLNVETSAMSSTTYYEKTINGDHFLFMTLEKSGSPNEYSEFSDEQLNWLEGLLKKYKNDGHKIVLFQHALIKQYGAGDDLNTPYYGGALNPEFDDVKRFMSILEANKDVIWFSGHSHVDFKYKYNISNMDGTTCYTVHIPSTSSTTHPNPSTGSNDYIMSADSSQGYFVDVYKDYVVLGGTDLVKNEIIPAYTYLIDYTGEALKENDMPDKPVINYGTATVTVDVKAVAETPAGVKVKLYGADDNTTSTVAMTKNSDGTYKAEVSKQFTKMQFIVNNGASETVSAEYDVADCIVVIGGMKITVNLADIKTKEGGSCTGWTVVNAYAWNGATNQNAGAWPGTAMLKNTDGTYSVLIPEAIEPNYIIFNNGTSQTADLTLEDKFIEGVFEGSYTLVGDDTPTETDPIETTPTETDPIDTKPTETDPIDTEPTETDPIDTKPTETDPIETNPTETEPVEYIYGDADLSGDVNIKDATTIQKYAADMITLDDVAFAQANVSGDKAVNVRDATAIQKFVAGLITEFPVEKKAVATVGATAAELSTLVATVKTTLSDESYYASYNAYMALKKAYMTYKSSTDTDKAYTAINDALTAYNTMKRNNPNHVKAASSSGGSLSAGTTTNATSIDGSKTGSYAIRGSFNNWGNSGLEYMVANSDGSYSISYQLTKGTYEFKFFDNDKAAWYGNSGTMNPGDSGWTFTNGTGNCKMNATEDGIYVFTYKYDTSSSKVKISLSIK